MISHDFSDISIFTLPVGQLAANCYLITDKKTKETLIIDPGDSADYIERIISDNQALPRCILATHGHFDHIMAAFELQTAYTIPFLIHKKDEFLVKDLRNRATHWLGIEPGPPPIITSFVKDTDILPLNATNTITLKVIETPGHTPGGICIYSETEQILFTGDLLFAGGAVGRTDFSYSSSDDLNTSIKKVMKLPCETIIFPGHGEPSTIKDEKQILESSPNYMGSSPE